MRLSSALVLAGMAPLVSATYTADLAAQTFFIPMPEQMLFDDTFKAIHKNKAVPPVHTMISVTISTDNTVIYYDHHEDDFDEHPTNPSSTSTEIWGDGNADNGCAPDVLPADCTNDNDKLMAGDAIIITNEVAIPRDNGVILYDGGDRLTASYPVAVVRGAFPEQPGSLMAGAVEVLDTSDYGKNFKAPCGTDTTMAEGETSAFQYVVFYVMASEDDTLVSFPGGSETLQMGETKVISVKQSDTVTATKPVLVDLITGDKWSTYELRWYSLLPLDEWSNEYLSSVGDSKGQTKVLLYNPGGSQITVDYDYLVDGSKTSASVTIPSEDNVFSVTIPTGSGAHFKSTDSFIALSLTDTVNTGQIYDWGFPVMPVPHLTSQVIIGLGFGCTENDCGSGDERSVVWVSALEDCYVHVDYNNDGNTGPPTFINALESKIFMDQDEDMSGALLYATKTQSKLSTPVPIAAAWGQNPAFSGSGDSKALDLGTVVLPFPGVHVTKSVELYEDVDGNNYASPGDILLYTIQVVNLGQVDINAGDLTIIDYRPDYNYKADYVEGSTEYYCETLGSRGIEDDTSGTAFPLDDPGLPTQSVLHKRGGTHDITFKVEVKSDATGDLVNKGKLTMAESNVEIPFKAKTRVYPALDWQPTPFGSCMQDNWKTNGMPGTLSCTAKQVFLEPDTLKAVDDMPCQKGKPITLNLKAKVHFNGPKYDPGWYIAKDGGDAMTGQCAISYLAPEYEAAVNPVVGPLSNIPAATVVWDQDEGTNDECGDLMTDGGGGVFDYNILVETELDCTDSDNNGKMDISMCFTWRNPGLDNICSVVEKLSQGKAPTLYPGERTGSCFCAQYEIPNVVVLDPGDKEFPC